LNQIKSKKIFAIFSAFLLPKEKSFITIYIINFKSNIKGMSLFTDEVLSDEDTVHYNPLKLDQDFSKALYNLSRYIKNDPSQMFEKNTDINQIIFEAIWHKDHKRVSINTQYGGVKHDSNIIIDIYPRNDTNEYNSIEFFYVNTKKEEIIIQASLEPSQQGDYFEIQKYHMKDEKVQNDEYLGYTEDPDVLIRLIKLIDKDIYREVDTIPPVASKYQKTN
jgi:hypothetical protein